MGVVLRSLLVLETINCVHRRVANCASTMRDSFAFANNRDTCRRGTSNGGVMEKLGVMNDWIILFDYFEGRAKQLL